MPDDRLSSSEADKKLPQPEVYIVRNGEAVFKPGMKTWFVETRKGSAPVPSGEMRDGNGAVMRGMVCTCNPFCTCEATCSCNPQCACQPVCSCDPVCSCNPVCSCQTTCSCQVTCSCQTTGSTCTCNTVCTCNPVH
ncbi:MAG: hypothetical protein IKP22_02125 [Clostridia bacterium]|nr:hypothetical protein [Clostridia bacterium]